MVSKVFLNFYSFLRNHSIPIFFSDIICKAAYLWRMKIISYNVNGIRSALSKGLTTFMQGSEADIFCFQETKAMQEQVEPSLFETEGFVNQYWFSAEKKGYSGVAIYSKKKPNHVEFGFGNPEYDKEGRIIRADFGELSVISVYIPSGSSGEDRAVVA